MSDSNLSEIEKAQRDANLYGKGFYIEGVGRVDPKDVTILFPGGGLSVTQAVNDTLRDCPAIEYSPVKPTIEGDYLCKSMETDHVGYTITIKRIDDVLWVNDALIGTCPLDTYHDNLTDVEYYRAPEYPQLSN